MCLHQLGTLFGEKGARCAPISLTVIGPSIDSPTLSPNPNQASLAQALRMCALSSRSITATEAHTRAHRGVWAETHLMGKRQRRGTRRRRRQRSTEIDSTAGATGDLREWGRQQASEASRRRGTRRVSCDEARLTKKVPGVFRVG
jgi:hypothetical protein